MRCLFTTGQLPEDKAQMFHVLSVQLAVVAVSDMSAETCSRVAPHALPAPASQRAQCNGGRRGGTRSRECALLHLDRPDRHVTVNHLFCHVPLKDVC
jgi:hypothetical protein